jgi:hypothetical protein
LAPTWPTRQTLPGARWITTSTSPRYRRIADGDNGGPTHDGCERLELSIGAALGAPFYFITFAVERSQCLPDGWLLLGVMPITYLEALVASAHMHGDVTIVLATPFAVSLHILTLNMPAFGEI